MLAAKEVLIGKHPVLLSERIGKGGEGEVYKINDRSDQVVKVYAQRLRGSRENKVRAMVDAGLADQSKLVAYPEKIVTDRSANFIGFMMRLVSGFRPLHELYSPTSRKHHFPNADYRFIVHAALNVARAVGTVHETGCIIGDLNHSGVLVAQNATVSLIDADSFQFKSNNIIYPCVVGVPDFTAPELHGTNLATIERTIDHDNFSLGVAIFLLLFMGRHPYMGLGPDISLGEAIAQNRFAYSLARQQATQTKPPPGTLTLDVFPDTIAHAFENAFGLIPTNRPSALDWIQILSRFESSLKHCTSVKTHYYPPNSRSCSWCELAKYSGVDLFLDLGDYSPNIKSDTRGTEQAIREILEFRFPTAADILPPPKSRPRSSKSLRKVKMGEKIDSLIGYGIMLGAILGLLNLVELWYVWLGGAYWGWIILSDRGVNKARFLQTFKDSEIQLQREFEAFIKRSGLIEVIKVRSDLDSTINAYKNHDAFLAHELKILKTNRESRQLRAYLDRFSVRNASISGIGPVKTNELLSFGIETAADVEPLTVRRVPGFGDVMTAKLLEWRRKHELRFKYNPSPNAQDAIDERSLRKKFATEKIKIEAAIRNGLGSLRNARARIEILPKKANNDSALVGAVNARAQARHDLETLGVSFSIADIHFPETPKPAQPANLSSVVLTTQGQRVSHTSKIKKQAIYCPRCSAPMRRRHGKYGGFWGCSRYPICRGTRKL